MTFRDYLRVLRERWRLITSIVLVALVLGILTTELTTKVYQATAQVFVVSNGSSDPLAQFQAAAFAQAQVATYAELVHSPDIMKAVQTDLNLPTSLDDLRSKITATAPAARTLVDITASDGSAVQAAAIANSTARAFVTVIEQYSISKAAQSAKSSANSSGSGTPTVRLVLSGPATAPSSPTTPKPVLNLSVALIVGALIGVSAAVLREVLDNRIKTEDRLSETAAAPVMGVIVDDPKTTRFPIATRAGAHNMRAENFRQMRANLQFANVDVHPRVIAVTSSIPGEGKTTIAINLASTLAETGFRVCLVDSDLRRPSLATVLGLVSPVGLTSVLIQQIDLGDALQQVTETLSVLASGPVPPNPSEVLSSSYVRTVIRSLLDRFDYVILDTAPLLPVADGSEVAALADGALLVAQHKKTTDSQVRRAAQSLRRVDAALIGVVLNRVRQSRSGPYGYSYYRYEQAEEAKVRPRPVRDKGEPGGSRPDPNPTEVHAEPTARQ